MKKWLFLLLAFIPFRLHANVTDPQVVQEKTYVVHYTTTIAANITSFVDLIDLSTTSTVVPHLEAIPQDLGELDINAINLFVDKTAASTETIKLGVCTFVSNSTGSVSYFFSNPSQLNVSNTNAVIVPNFNPTFYKTKVIKQTMTDGLTPGFLTTDKDSGLSVFSSTAAISSPVGNPIFPSFGDIILKIINGTTAINVTIDVWYHAER